MVTLNHRIRHTQWVRPIFIFSFLGSPAIWNTLLGILPLVFAALHRPYEALVMMACFLQHWLGFQVLLQHLIRRPRPFRELPDVTCLDPLTGTSRYSCPSGHAMYFAHFWLVMAYLCPQFPTLQGILIGVALILGICLALSRVLLGVHYPLDVLFGLTLPYVSLAVYHYLTSHVWSVLIGWLFY